MFFEVGPANSAARSLRISSRPTVTSTVPTVICMGLRCFSGSSSATYISQPNPKKTGNRITAISDGAEIPGSRT